ncbi:MAG: hypothetical protein HY318_07475 [Armatimonadetes bacterium]|nr:hypothetical protein [Armatimonadota bacterium]
MARTLSVAFLVASASLCSGNALSGLVQYDFGYGTYFVYEAVVFLVEAVIIMAFAKVPMRIALLVSFFANVASVSVGMIPGTNPLLGIPFETIVAIVALRKHRPWLVAPVVFGVNLFTLVFGSMIVVGFVPSRGQLSFECGQNLHAIGGALHEYAKAHDGRLPAVKDFSELRTSLTPYMRGKEKAFSCPLTSSIVDDPGYIWSGKLSGRALEGFRDRAPQIVAVVHPHTCRPPLHSFYAFGSVLYLDGHVGAITPSNEKNIAVQMPIHLGTQNPNRR